MRRFVQEGEIYPRGYGLAWHDFVCNRAVAYPIPLNILFGWLRAAYVWLRFRAVPTEWDGLLLRAYHAGRKAEWQSDRAQRDERDARAWRNLQGLVGGGARGVAAKSESPA